MTIKQHGGIFGRNPTFNTVDVESSLNIDGQLTTDGLVSSKSGGSGGEFIGYSSVLDVSNNNNGQISFGNNTNFQGIISYEGATSGNFYFDNSWNNSGAALVFRNKTATAAEELGRFNSNGLVLPNGKGIDFSATSGTGTSELFDDYEEGTWTPTLNAYGGTPTVSGYYVKIGQIVYVECSITLDGTSDASGYIIDGLPFTMASPYLGGGAVNTNDGGVADVLIGSDPSSRLRLRDSSNTNYSYTGVGVSSTVTLNAQYRAA
jgi:hypothetical protein